jgi:glutathione S-transferase
VAAANVSFVDSAPSWDALRELVRAQEAARGVNLLEPDYENGPTHPLALKRTFGSSEPVRVKLYRDHAAWCPYCQKVWLQLEEKRIPYVIQKENMRCYGPKSPSFMAMVPSGLLPVLELDGRVVTESAVIMALLEDAFPDHKPLMPPAGTPERARADALMRLERRFFGAWLVRSRGRGGSWWSWSWFFLPCSVCCSACYQDTLTKPLLPSSLKPPVSTQTGVVVQRLEPGAGARRL